ncbi:phosphatidylserine decarboxylase family protein [Flavobacteriaceae bacterium]|jgi:phosphatidylserine decarboxylase|nr:phosphatidylserine decarboxylase family protein [Flavobacteriaceae bacterium]
MFHKEGFKIIINTFLLCAAIALTSEYLVENLWIQKSLQVASLLIMVLVLQFFRNPKRITIPNDNEIISPVDGKVVVIKEVFEKEFFKDKRLQVSIFMSPINVHVTRYAISGSIVFSKYHPGKYLVAWHPKSSELNERTTVVVENKTIGQVLYRQIAGAVARRIVNYAKVGDEVVQGTDAGFIKFGSRVDVFLPISTQINVKKNQIVRGGKDCIAEVLLKLA